jgi:hypothetical protein
MHYRSVLALGVAAVVAGDDKLAALRQISDHLFPGRWADVRPPSGKELAKTMVMSLPLTECSVKISDGPPDDRPEDVALPCWAGVVPMRPVFGEPIDAPDLTPGIAPPAYLTRWQ